jgi:hypothetical protein
LPSGQPGRPSRAMTQTQASKVLKAASGQRSGSSRWSGRATADTARPAQRQRPSS